jgi:hypothetical protein
MKQRKARGQGHKKPEGSKESKRVVGVILQVLAGVLGPYEAAEVLKISPTMYYKIEERALDGMLAACEPRQKGKQKTPQSELKGLKEKYAKLERERARYQTLLRASNRAVGLYMPKNKEGQKDKRGRKKKRPTTRALKLAERLKDKEGTDDAQGETAKGSEAGREAGRVRGG